MRHGVSYPVYMYTLGAGRIFIKSIIIVCLLNLMAWKASWVHITGENEEKKDNDKIKNRSKRRAPVAKASLIKVYSSLLLVSILWSQFSAARRFLTHLGWFHQYILLSEQAGHPRFDSSL